MKKSSVLAGVSVLAATVAASLFLAPDANAAAPVIHPDAWHYYSTYQYDSQCVAEANYLVDNGFYSNAECVRDAPVYDLYVWY